MEMALRIGDAFFALFWLWLLIRSLTHNRIGGNGGFKYGRAEKPGTYWFGIFIVFAMVMHFGSLAIIGWKFSS
ncbi:MAG: hypothetical protein ABI673_10515 [Novosphingobium sp.]